MIVRKSKHQYKVELGKVLPSPYSPDQLVEVKEWCEETFGKGGRHKQCKWRYGWVDRVSDIFHFKSERDALHFVLRWS